MRISLARAPTRYACAVLPLLLTLFSGCGSGEPAAPPARPAPTTPAITPGPDALLLFEPGDDGGCTLRLREDERSRTLGVLPECPLDVRFTLHPDGDRLAVIPLATEQAAVILDLRGGVTALPPLEGLQTVRWAADGMPVGIVAQTSPKVADGWAARRWAYTNAGWEPVRTIAVPFDAGTRTVQAARGYLRVEAPTTLLEGLVGLAFGERVRTVDGLAEGAQGLVDGHVAVQRWRRNASVPAGPIALKLVGGRWFRPGPLADPSPATWEETETLAVVRLHGDAGERDDVHTTWVYDRRHGGAVDWSAWPITPWPLGTAAHLPPEDPACPPGATPGPIEAARLAGLLPPDCRPPEELAWAVSPRHATDWWASIAATDTATACTDASGALVGPAVLRRALPEGTLVLTGAPDGKGTTRATMEVRDGARLVLFHGDARPGGGRYWWMCPEDPAILCACGAAAGEIGVMGRVAEWSWARGGYEARVTYGGFYEPGDPGYTPENEGTIAPPDVELLASPEWETEP